MRSIGFELPEWVIIPSLYMAYMRRYSTRKYKPYYNRRYFRRTGRNIDARRDSITFKMREFVEITPAGTIGSCTLNPLY